MPTTGGLAAFGSSIVPIERPLRELARLPRCVHPYGGHGELSTRPIGFPDKRGGIILALTLSFHFGYSAQMFHSHLH